MKYKNEVVIVVVVSMLILVLKWINVFQIENGFGNPWVILTMIIAFSMMGIHLQKRMDRNHEKQGVNYKNLDVLKYICAILIIILHLRPFFDYSNPLDLAFNNIITRVCVPLFFVITGYFTAIKEKEQPDYMKKHVSKMIPLYLTWSALYIPILINDAIHYLPTIQGYMDTLQFSAPILILLLIVLSPLVVIVTLVYTGVYYHLWYFPAVMLSLLVLRKWKERFPVKNLLILSFILLLFGATETYYGVLPLTIQQLITFYYKIFFTTRNFLFFGLFYVVLGYCMGKKKEVYSEHCVSKLIISMFFLVFEAIILHDFDRLNSNILLCCIPLTYYLFIFTLYVTRKKEKKINLPYRDLSKYYYLVHPAVIALCFSVFNIVSIETDPYRQIAVVLLFTHLVSYFFMILKRYFKRLPI